MSENPNPTVCGTCLTENPPGAEYCEQCGQPLTLQAELAESGAPVDMPLDSPEATDPAKTSFPTD